MVYVVLSCAARKVQPVTVTVLQIFALFCKYPDDGVIIAISLITFSAVGKQTFNQRTVSP